VGLFFWIAIAAGWIKSEESGPDISALPPLSTKTASTSSGKGLTVPKIYRSAAPGVVFIQADIVQTGSASPFDLFPQRQEEQATGSGFVLDKNGYILTNAHVVQGARSIRVGFEDRKSATAKKVGEDVSDDLALLKVNVDKDLLHPLALGDSRSVQVGNPVVAIGNPFGLDRTVTTGIVSALQRRIEAPNGFSITDVIQTDASINPGNSGGPLIDAAGHVIGINSQIATGGGNGSIGIGFAIPINTARRAIADLKRHGEVRHAFMGVTGLDLTQSLASDLNLGTSHGVLVQHAVSGGPADKAGIRGGKTQVTIGGLDVVLGGDIITAVNGKKVEGMDEVVNAVDARKPGDKMNVTILRGHKQRTVKVTLGSRPQRLRQTADLPSPLGP
jgi:S1-C subfamily serine protease